MIALENLDYTLVQVAHNFGAVAIVGGSVFALYPSVQAVAVQRKLAWLVGAGWAVQALSGMGFAAVSYYFYGKLPDIHGIALAALLVKMLCAACGFGIAAIYLRYAPGWTAKQRRTAWQQLIALGVTALTAAAFLRWFA